MTAPKVFVSYAHESPEHRDRDTWTPKVLPVLLPGHEIDEIPYFLSPYTTSRFTVAANTVKGAEDLLRVIHGRPGHVPPPLLPPPDLPPHPAPVSVVWCAGMPVDHDPEDVEVHLVPDGPLAPLDVEAMRRALDPVAASYPARVDVAGSTAWFADADVGLGVAGLPTSPTRTAETRTS